MVLEETYRRLYEQGLTSSNVDFSRKWLNKSARYMSMLRASGREPSVDTLARLLANLKLQYDAYRTSHVNIIQQRADAIKPILTEINKELLAAAQSKNVHAVW